MRADVDAGVRRLPQDVVEAIPAPSALDGIAPDEHPIQGSQLGSDFVGEIVVIDRRLGCDADGAEGVEQGREAALGGIGAITCGAIARIEQCQ